MNTVDGHTMSKDCWCEPKVEYVGGGSADAVLDECRSALIASETALTAAQDDALTARAYLRTVLDGAAAFAAEGGVAEEWCEQDAVMAAEVFLGEPHAN